jgi:hypothetical protein
LRGDVGEPRAGGHRRPLSVGACARAAVRT